MNREKSPEEIHGLEYDWLACDANGFVGLFSTAGGGYAPREFLLDTEAHDEALDAILELPASTEARFAPKLLPNLQNTWQLVAERGLFAFDSDSHGGPYRQVAAPVVPIQIEKLPEPVRKLVGSINLQRIRFDSHSVISVELLI
ncbi:MAG TPA: hypothetical protein PK156_30325 [Polyangium sp.]|nr:hypothetical protein [Polyangium sp.]